VAAAPTPAPTAGPTPEPVAFDDHPFAVMIDNIAEARPQTGLGQADVVYEAPAEGGIPRLMPLYLRAGVEVGRIGPVRSTRHYFVFLADEYRAPLVHIGASPQGFDELDRTGLPDVDEARGDGGFTRDSHRLAPHNAFVSTDSIHTQLAHAGVRVTSGMGPLQFGAFKPGAEGASTVHINYPGAEGYKVQYDYDPATKTYPRMMDGVAHKDGTSGEQYAARSIIVQYADVEPIPNDDKLRVDITLVGTGKATLIAEGTQVPLTWTKNSVDEPTQFKRADGSPFLLPNGQVWVQVVPLDTKVTIS
jgi:hypothetical protein